ncbi:endonuclease/exonuclease/phosphatase family protein [Microbacterium sp. X-17]|uniref:endonuclease/exonuclease/phosphatase family protein n=1 Tax=Microbacterium sp. X-17 TaxID=3144404 RepID=UPI0031F5D86F
MRRLLGILVTIVVAIPAIILTWPGFFHLERTFPLAQIISFRTIVVLVLGALLVVCLLLALARPMRALMLAFAVVFAVTAGVGGFILLQRGVGSNQLPSPTDTSLRIMTWNTAGTATSAQVIAQTAVAMSADVVTLPETTVDTGEAVAVAMRNLGRPMWVHHTTLGPWAADSTTILISPELGDYSVIESSADGSSNTSTVPSAVAMPIDGKGPTIVAAHAVAPRQEDIQHWRDDLQWLADQCAGGNVIMAGDFNATLDHMTGLGTDGGTLGDCRDAAAATGNGAVGTWPTSLPELVGAPIDHVMATPNWKATGSIVLDALDDSGSDHRPLVVQLEPAG